jgi:hypothetical protein
MSVNFLLNRRTVLIFNALALVTYVFLIIKKTLLPGHSASIGMLWVLAAAPVAAILAFSARPERRTLFLFAFVLNAAWLCIILWAMYVLKARVYQYVDTGAMPLLLFASFIFFIVPLFTITACVHRRKTLAGL